MQHSLVVSLLISQLTLLKVFLLFCFFNLIIKTNKNADYLAMEVVVFYLSPYARRFDLGSAQPYYIKAVLQLTGSLENRIPRLTGPIIHSIARQPIFAVWSFTS